MEMKDLVGIYDEEGNKNNDQFEVIKRTTHTKNVILIKNMKTEKERMIHKDRVFLLDDLDNLDNLDNLGNNLKKNKGEETMEQKKSMSSENLEKKKKAKKKKKSLVKFDVTELKNMGITFRSKKESNMDSSDQKMVIESFCIVSDDGSQWKHFNLYNGSLGKNGRTPEFGENDSVKIELSGNLEAIEKYLVKKGYDKI